MDLSNDYERQDKYFSFTKSEISYCSPCTRLKNYDTTPIHVIESELLLNTYCLLVRNDTCIYMMFAEDLIDTEDGILVSFVQNSEHMHGSVCVGFDIEKAMNKSADDLMNALFKYLNTSREYTKRRITRKYKLRNIRLKIKLKC